MKAFSKPVRKDNTDYKRKKTQPIYIFISEEINSYTNQVTDLYQFHTKRTNEPATYNVVVLVM